MNSPDTSLVYRNFDQQALDAQYNNRARFPDFERHFAQWSTWSEATRMRLPSQLDLHYGPGRLETVDVFPAENRGAPIYVFIHGGYWYSLDKSDYSYVAEGMRPHGVTTAVNNFTLAPEAGMDTIVRQNRECLAWLWRNARQLGADPDRIYVCGHSAGGHLGLMLLATDWPSHAPDLPSGLVKGVCSIGGIFDLEPIRLSFLNQKLRLSVEEARRNSPLNVEYPARSPLSLVVAVDESEEFHRQSREMEQHWKALGHPVDYLVPPGLDHFNVVNDLANPACSLVGHQLDQMRLAFAPR